MGKYLLGRLLFLIPMLFLISVIVFWAMRMIPVDPAELVVGPFASAEQRELARQKLGLDKPIPLQYIIWLQNVFQGDFGRSVKSGKEVALLIRDTLPNTLSLSLVSLVIAYVIAVPMGALAAVKQNTIIDQAAMFFAMLGMAVPHFWLGLLFILAFAVGLQWLPASGTGSWQHYVLPALTLGLEGTALTARMTRSSMLEVLRQDYVRTARAKGLVESRVIAMHALRNAMIPIVSLLGLRLGLLVGGAVIVETIFTWPGMGRLLVEGIINRDYPVVQTTLVLLGGCILVANLLADLLYTVVDPRIRLTG